MTFTADGIIQTFLDLLGVTVDTASGQYIAFIVSSSVFGICIVAFLLLLFKFLVYLRKG